MANNASQQTPTTDAPEVEFLTFTSPSQWRTRKTQALVRAHITRRQHQRRREENSFRAMTGIPASDRNRCREKSQKTICVSSRGPAPSTPPLMVLSAAQRSYSNGAAAFQVILLQDSDNEVGPCITQLGTDVRTILDKYLFIIDSHAPEFEQRYGSETIQGNAVRDRFYPLMFTDAAPMAASLLLAASYMVYGRGENPSTNAALLRLRSFVMQKIQQALSDDPKRAISDQLISAVVLMAKYEALYGRRENHAMHMQGLLSMIRRRGGLSNLGLEGVLQRVVMWFDLNTAKVLGTSLYCNAPTEPSKVMEDLMLGAILTEAERPREG